MVDGIINRKVGELKVTDATDKPEPQTPVIGQRIVYTDTYGKTCDALVTNVFSRDCVNMVIVNSDESQKDDYGRKIFRVTSCMRKSEMSAHGNFWEV